MFVRNLRYIALVAALLANAGIMSAQDAPAEAPANAAGPVESAETVARADARNRAVAFLKRVEERNKETKTLQSDFVQVRVEAMFKEETKSKGKFWYKAPNQFHAQYEAKHPTHIWMDGDRYVEHNLSIRQVDIFPMEKGEAAQINQLLLGFGVKVDEIEKLFDVGMITATEKDTAAIEFLSKDLKRSMNFRRIVVHFNEKKTEPVRLILEDDQSVITMDLKNTKFNPTIRDGFFDLPTWPAKTGVNDYTKQ